MGIVMKMHVRTVTMENETADGAFQATLSETYCGYVAELTIHRGYAVLARKDGTPWRVLVMPSERWANDLRDAGWEIGDTIFNSPEWV